MTLDSACRSKKSNNGKDQKRKKRGEGNDAKRVSQRLSNFSQNESMAFKTITNRFSKGITHKELKKIAEILAENNGLHLDRDAKRDNRVLIKWFDENWDLLRLEIEKINAFDENMNNILCDQITEAYINL